MSDGTATDYTRERRCGSSLLVEIYLWEKDIEAAWKQAQAEGVNSRFWQELAQKREKTHPADAAAAYRKVVEDEVKSGGNESYSDAVKLVLKIQSLLRETKLEKQSHPSQLNSFAVQVKHEIGIDISRHYSKSFDDLQPGFLVKLDYVIALCAEEVCPVVIPKAKKWHWPFRDPASESRASPMPDCEQFRRYREARDGIRAPIEVFATEVSGLSISVRGQT